MKESTAGRPEPPPAAGVRLPWADLPAHLRAAVEAWLGGAVVAAESQAGGFSPGVAARLRTADGRRVFSKAAGPEPNPFTPLLHRREAEIVAALPAAAPVPRLLWTHDEGSDGWVVLVFEDAEGRQPAVPWRVDDLDRVLDALVTLSTVLTPSPLPPSVVERAETWTIFTRGWWRQIGDDPPPGLDDWSTRHLAALVDLEAGAPAAVAGETLLHLDLRADNLLLTPERVLVVDWPHARLGAAWVDPVCFAPSVTMPGGPDPDDVLTRFPAARAADPAAINAVVAAIAGFWTRMAFLPAPPGLPTLRTFQAAHGAVARRWLAHRTGWA